MSTSLALKGVSKLYRDHVVLDQLELECQSGEFLVLLGRSGAGKSTTLRIVAGIDAPSAGQVLLGDQTVTDLPPEQRDIAMAFESYALYPHLTVREHFAFPLKAPGRKLSSATIDQRIAAVADLLEIAPLLGRRPTQLSGGQRQRVSLGRALVRHARLTLLDEPVAHLDARLRHDLRGELKRHQREHGATTLYATPDFSEAAAIADRIVVMIDGRVRQIDTPQDLYDRPADVDVALLAGDLQMNVLDAETVRPYSNLPTETRLVGLRASSIQVHQTAEPDAIPGQVYVAEPMGYDQIVRVDISGQVVTARMPIDERRFEIGAKVWISPRWHEQHCFGPDGRRLRVVH